MPDTAAVSADLALYEPPALPAASGARWGVAATSHRGLFVYPGRRVLHLPGWTWTHQPAGCPVVDRNIWMLEGAVLVCAGCGLDGT